MATSSSHLPASEPVAPAAPPVVAAGPFAAPRQLTAGGVQFQYLEFGNPQDSPLVHGFPDAPSAWAGVVTHLDLTHCRVVALYLRGYGQTTVLDPARLGGQQWRAAVAGSSGGPGCKPTTPSRPASG